MAHYKSGSNNTIVVVQKGDTLWGIASKYLGSGTKYTQLASINGIPSPYYIYVGNEIKLTSDATGGSSPSGGGSSNAPKITSFGEKSTEEGSLFAFWSWSKTTNLSGYLCEWTYRMQEGPWFLGSSSTNSYDKNNPEWSKVSEYSVPSGAVEVKFRVKPIAEDKPSSSSSTTSEKVPYWTADWSETKSWSRFEALEFDSTPTVTIGKYNDNAVAITLSLDNVDTKKGAYWIEFQVFQDDGATPFNQSSSLELVNGHVEYKFNAPIGYKYKCRCRALNKAKTSVSEWSDFTDNSEMPPKPVDKIISCEAYDNGLGTDSSTGLKLTWKPVTGATQYELQYSTDKEQLESNNNVESNTYDDTNIVDGVVVAILTGLEPGQKYFFRVQARNSSDVNSKWSEIIFGIFGTKPNPPTTYSVPNASVATTDSISLYWVHNPTDNSRERSAYIRIYPQISITASDIKCQSEYFNISKNIYTSNSSYTGITITRKDPNDTNAPTIGYITIPASALKTSSGSVVSKIRWDVKTKGIFEEHSESSTLRQIDVFDSPELNMYLKDYRTGSYGAYFLGRYPVDLLFEITPTSQKIMGLQLDVLALDTYYTTDLINNRDIMIAKGDAVYSKYFTNITAKTVDDVLTFNLKLTPADIDLESGHSYKIKATVYMNSGLSCNDLFVMDVSWAELGFAGTPSAKVVFHKDNFTTTITPTCSYSSAQYAEVELANGKYRKKKDSNGKLILVDTNGIYNKNQTNGLSEADFKSAKIPKTVPLGFTTDGAAVYNAMTYSGDASWNMTGTEKLVCQVSNETLTPNALLAVYRRDYDGKLTLIANGIQNGSNTSVVDPHPSLDYGRYRVIAESALSGEMLGQDISPLPIGVTSIILQWDEEWREFEGDSTTDLVEKPWNGSLLELKYNVKVAPNASVDSKLVSYIGREHPVSYYGTQINTTDTWNTEIPRDDKDTIYALRRLQAWKGDVYVREPTGSGYWANITVSWNNDYSSMVIPITINVTRVEGGA